MSSATPIYDCLSNGDTAKAIAVILGGANPNELDPFDGEPALRIAASRRYKDVALALIEAGADVNYVEADPDTARDMYGGTSIVKTLYLTLGKTVAKAAAAKGAVDNTHADSRFVAVPFSVAMLDDVNAPEEYAPPADSE